MIGKLKNWKIGAIDRRNALVLGWKVERRFSTKLYFPLQDLLCCPYFVFRISKIFGLSSSFDIQRSSFDI
jgi:hypothetical protein